MSEAALRSAVPPHVPKDAPTATILERLHTIQGHLEQCMAHKKYCTEDVHHFREELREIDDAREAAGGIFGGHLDKEDPAKSSIPPGQAECSDALASCYALVEQMKDGAQPMSSGATEILHQLQGIKRWLTEAAAAPGRVNLHDLQRHGGMLDKIDATRQAHGGVFGGDLKAGDIPAGQAVLSSLLAGSYKLLEQLKAIVPDKKEA